jgi:hypothetical protein
MDFHVITATEQKLVMQTTEGGYLHRVFPAPPSSLPPAAALARPAPDR